MLQRQFLPCTVEAGRQLLQRGLKYNISAQKDVDTSWTASGPYYRQWTDDYVAV